MRMAFQFNFNIDQEEQEIDRAALPHSAGMPGSKSNEADVNVGKNQGNLRPAKELYPPPTLSTHESYAVDTLKIGELELFHLRSEDIEFDRQREAVQNDSDVATATKSHSDLIPSIYEGGLKVWECSVDLVNFLHETDIPLKGKRVLELGCGVGLPGIYAVKKGAATVHFQDYNEEVIERMTIPSVMLNRTKDDASSNQNLRFFAGDWSTVQEKLMSDDTITKYDIILTSETIYNSESHDKLYQIFRATLDPNGIIYLAAKTHYFGVGGGTRIFEDMVKRHGEFYIDVCRTYPEGVKREIVKMEFLKPAS